MKFQDTSLQPLLTPLQVFNCEFCEIFKVA